MAIRRLLHAHGFRYRIATRPLKELNRRADIVFPRQMIAIFIDGCFWHGCPDHGTREFKVNIDYWPTKIATNMRRDADTTRKLLKSGWTVLRFWEHEPPADVVAKIESTVSTVSGANDR